MGDGAALGKWSWIRDAKLPRRGGVQAGHRHLEWGQEKYALCEVSFQGEVDSSNATTAAKAVDDVARS